MNIRQLRALCEVVKQGLRISAAADALHTSQPGVSRQILDLEEELGVEIFVRRGHRVIAVSEPGRRLVAFAQRIVRDAENMRSVAADHRGEGVGTLTIATTHTHAYYTLPKFIQSFSSRFPQVSLHLREGSPAQCCELVAQAEADIGIVTETPEEIESIATLPAYRLPRCLVTPAEHPLLKAKPLTLEKIARFPLITYDASFSSRRSLDRAFARKGLTPNVVLRAIDADVSKKYVSLGLGVAILPKIAFEPAVDHALRMRELDGLLEHGLVSVCVRRENHLREYVYAFIANFASHLTRRVVDKALRRAHEGSPPVAPEVPFADF